MPSVKVLNQAGKEVGEIALNDSVFGIEPSVPAMHLCVVAYLANRRQGTQSTLTRAEVRGGGRKPWRQKGTGRARQGSTRSPQWKHGGIAHGPKPRKYKMDVNRKVRRLAIRSALSGKVASDSLIVLDSLQLEEIKTKEVAKVLSAVNAGKKVLFVLAENDDVIYRSARNLPGVNVSQVLGVNVYDILNADTLVVVKSAAEKLEEVYA
ncbi:MAG: 50S ribosomal protein L4 [Oscillospiraceae bacterium]|jgi:large subunit ribosomal protein L4|nr:50S ribosomal protein L4 [Oscillospiraceae bacterium]